MTKELSIDRLKKLLIYDQHTGVFTRAVSVGRHGVHRSGEVAGTLRSDGYTRIGVDHKKYEAARLAWFYMTGDWPTGDVDHRDGNPMNNRWENLRNVPHRANIENRCRANSNNSTGFLGVTKDKRRPGLFKAQISTKGKNIEIGFFQTAEEAHGAYITTKRAIHEGNML